ncbi:hypothetical protein Cabys_2517 [Caldithrix abyssi DSM 13497]|uniref:Uncharacterized protein n=1 Tax=Caldithrix abyssi DSM 13497 TaxID=880073 RepID=A0A1J1CB98_CALAY|nr:hypothetical protein Cabys_2517 [Caldithrix abyssi DSM 13497]
MIFLHAKHNLFLKVDFNDSLNPASPKPYKFLRKIYIFLLNLFLNIIPTGERSCAF